MKQQQPGLTQQFVVGLCLVLSIAAAPRAAAQGLHLDGQASASALAWQQHGNRDNGHALHTQLEGSARYVTPMAGAWTRSLQTSVRLRDSTARCPSDLCEESPALEGTFGLGLSHYAWGNFLLGRQASLLAEVAQRSTVMASDMLGSGNCAALLAPSCPRLRPISLSWTGLRFTQGWTPALQLAGGGEGPFTVNSSLEVEVMGGRLLSGFSWRDDGSWLLPLGLTLPLGRWQVSGLFTQGRTTQGKGRHAELGASIWLAGGEWRMQASSLRQHSTGGMQALGEADGRRWALGHYRPLNMHWAAYADISQTRSETGRRFTGADAGLRWTLR